MVNTFFLGVKYRNDVVNQDNICSKCIHMVNYASGYGYCFKKYCAKSSVSGDCDSYIPNILNRKIYNLSTLLEAYLSGNTDNIDPELLAMIDYAKDNNHVIGSELTVMNTTFKLFGIIPEGLYSEKATFIYVADPDKIYLKEQSL